MCDLQKSILEYCRSKDQNIEETNGFDLQAGLSWIYPTNYPLRDYQFNIIQQALFKNTLVSLPTGLGKTFIAAVVMYNFYRWYPTGKIIFMAPTKPLVKQQIDACYNIMAIPQNVTAELTGMKQNSTRNNIWLEKRVFFVTPQVLQNDLTSFPDLGVSIKCIVFDEAHKARGNYAYCEVIRILRCQTQYFRVLALSATPGNGTDDIGEVIRNLMISHLEFRNEESPDVKPFVFRRKLETIVIPLGEKLNEVKTEFSQILEKYTRNLMKYQIIQGNYSTLTKGRIFMAKAEYQKRNVRPPNYNEVMRDLNICMSLYHANELLIRHGLRGFLSFLDQHADHVLLRGIVHLMNLREKLREYLGPLPNVDPMPDGSYPEVPLRVKFGHPKYYKLQDILISHFTNSEDNSKVIVFFEYRDSVMEAFTILLQARPLVRAKIFLGQKFGITQRVQLNVIKSFRDGDCNTLLSTCIGEEGLDVGDVDLIVCFDVSTRSPIRMVQRMGRTGRKREGQVIILVTEGKEQQTLNECLIHKNNLKNWVGSSRLFERFFIRSPRMVPENIDPQCMKMHITVEKPMITKKSTIKDMFRTISSNSSSSLALSEDVEIIEIEEKIPQSIMLFNKSHSDIVNFNFEPHFNKHIENQRSLQCGEKIQSSDNSNIFVSLMKFADSRRFNIPLTQDVDKESCNKNLKQGDIRCMFTKSTNKDALILPQDDFITQKCQSSASCATQNVMHTQSLKPEPKSDELYKELHLEISNYLSIELTMNRSCDICDNLFQYSIQNKMYNDKCLEDLKHWIPPDFSRIKRITLEDLESYEKILYTEPELEENNLDNSILDLLDGHDISNIISGANMDKEKLKDKSFTFNAPKSFSNLLDTFNISSTCPIKGQSEVEKVDISQKLNDLLLFFKLDRIEDIYESDNSLDNSMGSNKTIICVDSESPKDIFENYQLSPVLGTQKSPIRDSIKEIEPGSPILKTSKMIQAVIDKPKDRRSLDIIDTSIEENTNFLKNKLFVSQLTKPNIQKNMATSNMEIADINCDELNESKENSEDENLLGYFGSYKKRKLSNRSKHDAESLAIGDLCDLSAFGLTVQEELSEHKTPKNSSEIPNCHTANGEFLKRDDLFDTSVVSKTSKIEGNSNKLNLIGQHDNDTNETICNKSKTNISIDDFCDLSVFGLTQKDKNDELKDDFVGQNSQVRDLDSSNTNNLEMNDSEFDCFLNDLENKHMSTQRKFNGTKIDDNVKTLSIQSTPQKHRNESVFLKSSKSKHNEIVETVIIEDSPVKNDILDLTQSP
ncbi:hypothetical protein WA026_017996 [Henosepilachna vigintioctopunctata]|uniref:Fanconi anemia group M protein n=1 Tax=Henosepilachna vigintioctopunctata TaxID=420089 RepID=A0AAW1TM54_9CUCU